MNVLSYRRPALETIFLLAEGLAWFMVISVLATLVERSFLETLADRIAINIRPGALDDLGGAERVVRDLRAEAGTDAGPSPLVIWAAAAGGFLLMRYAPRLDLGRGLTSAVMVAATILGVNVLLHLAIGDLRIWDASKIVGLLNDPTSQTATGVDVEAFVADPEIGGPHAGALALTFVGIIAVWFRFMLAARSPVRLERMGKSFTASFVAVFVALFVARVGDVDSAGQWAVPQFVLGMLGLAVGNHERAVPSGEADERVTPWLTSVAGTLGLLAAAAGVIGLLAYLGFGSVLSAVGGLLLVVLEFAVILIVTPIYWIVSTAMSGVVSLLAFLFGGRGELPEILSEPLTPADVGLDEDEDAPFTIPAWLVDSLKFFAVVGTVWVMYWVGQRLLGARKPEPEAVVEQRTSRTGGAGIGALLSDLMSFRRKADADRWLNRNEVYRLFRQARGVSEERGLAMLPSETPSEFAESALLHLGSPPVADAARMFERARFGRHQPTGEELQNASRALTQWDQSNPATEELRERIRGHRPIDDEEQIRMRLGMAKKGLNPTDESILRGE